jgi:hypothetical protein
VQARAGDARACLGPSVTDQPKWSLALWNKRPFGFIAITYQSRNKTRRSQQQNCSFLTVNKKLFVQELLFHKKLKT